MLPEVEEHVDEPMARLGWVAERARMVAARPDVPAPAERSVDGLRAADGEPLNSADQRIRLVALDDEMDVIRLHGEVNDAKRDLVRGSERSPNECEQMG
jgi:hypothetical protein